MPQRSARHARSNSPSGWRAPLARPVELANGKILQTLHDAGRYIGDLPDRRRTVGLNGAAGALLYAAEHPTPENVATATDRLESALYFNRLLRRNAS